MKKHRISALLLAGLMLAGCSGQKMTLDLSFGKREGTYTGDLKDGVPDGKGKFKTENDQGGSWTYEGEFKNGHFDGEGTTTWSDGSKETGTYKDDVIVPLTGNDIKTLATDTDSFVNHVVSGKGEILVTPTLEDDVYFVQLNPIENDAVNENTPYWLYINADNYDLKMDEFNTYIEYTGRVMGAGEGTTAFGTEIKAPEIIVYDYKQIDYAEALMPAKETKDVKQSVKQHDFTLTLDKIEFAENETRLYVTAENNSKDNINLDCYGARIIQDGHQYDIEDNYMADYPQLSCEIYPWAKSSGVLVFPAFKNAPFELVMDAWSDNYDIQFDDFKITIK